MDKSVAKRFFKATQSLPPNESITAKYNCTLNADVIC